MDQQLYAVAMVKIWAIPDALKDHYVSLGPFHTQCTYIACIGRIWSSGGLRDLLVDSDVYAVATVDQMLLGKQFNRAIHGLTLVYEALMQVQIQAFVKWLNYEDR